MKEAAEVIKFNEETLPEINLMSQVDLSNQIYDKIKQAKPFSTIVIPNRAIILPQLNLLTPLTIIGDSGSVLEVMNGNIVCDFADFCNEQFKGISVSNHADFRIKISQISILFKFDPDKIL